MSPEATVLPKAHGALAVSLVNDQTWPPDLSGDEWVFPEVAAADDPEISIGSFD